ncbi:unnamed protein product [Brassica rapa subsp. trilocularis]
MENDLASDIEISFESDEVGAGEIEIKSDKAIVKPPIEVMVISPDTNQCIESFFDDHNMGFKHAEMRNCTGNTIQLHSQKTDYYRHQGVCPAFINQGRGPESETKHRGRCA